MDVAEAPKLFRERFTSRAQVQRYCDRFASGRRRRSNLREQATVRKLLHGLPALPVVLDLPCGAGRFAPLFTDLAARTILADASEWMLEAAGDIWGAKVSCLKTRAEQIELDATSVDLIFSHRFLMHLYDRELRSRILGEFRRVTRRYLITSYYAPSIRRRMRWSLRSLVGAVRRDDLIRSPGQLRREVTAAGFRELGSVTARKVPYGAFYLFERV